jgi:hypothetical protein
LNHLRYSSYQFDEVVASRNGITSSCPFGTQSGWANEILRHRRRKAGGGRPQGNVHWRVHGGPPARQGGVGGCLRSGNLSGEALACAVKKKFFQKYFACRNFLYLCRKFGNQIIQDLFRCAAALKYSKIQAFKHSTTRRKPNR